MDLRTLPLADDIRQALAAIDVTTAHDLLFTQTSRICQRLPIGVVSFRELTDLKVEVAQHVSALATRGDVLFKREEEQELRREPCLCGVEEVDSLLGGFGTYGVIEIAGDKKSGKTGLILQVILRHLAHYPHHKVFWLDTGGEFTVERAAEILQLNPGLGSDTALDRLTISTCFDVAAAHQAVEEFRISLEHKHDAEHRTRFLVVDPITPLFSPILNATSSQGHAIMITFMRQLASLARTYSLTTLITNTSVKWQPHKPYSAFPTTTTKPALGPSFTFVVDETLWLASAENLFSGRQHGMEARGGKVFIAEVFRSHITVSKTWCAFVIRNGVFFERFMHLGP